MKFLLLIVSLLTLFSCTSKKKSTPAQTVDSTKASLNNTTQSSEMSTEKPASKNGAVAGAGTWHYEKTIDKDKRTVYKASMISSDLLEFAFPYAGGSTATLTIRKRERDTHVYIRVSKGQFNRSFQGGNARVRFDKNPPVTYSFSAAENGSANVIFFDADTALIDRMKTARNMVIDVDFAGQGKRQIGFRTANLTWPY